MCTTPLIKPVFRSVIKMGNLGCAEKEETAEKENAEFFKADEKQALEGIFKKIGKFQCRDISLNRIDSQESFELFFFESPSFAKVLYKFIKDKTPRSELEFRNFLEASTLGCYRSREDLPQPFHENEGSGR